jgi:phage terminase small subunit
MTITPKQRRFVEEYLIDLNATQAAIRAGYSPKTAEVQGSRLLSNAKVQAAVSEGQNNRAARTQIDADWVLKRLVENVDRAMQVVAVKDSEGASTGEFKYEGNVANQALGLIGKHLGMFTDKVELGGKGGGPLVVQIVRFSDPPSE